MGLLENTIGAMLGHQAGQGSDRPSEGSPYAPLAAALIAMLGAKAMTGGFGDLGGLLGHRGGRAPAQPQPGAAPPSQQGEAGGVLGGLGGLIQHFQNGGAGGVVNSWVGAGQNQPTSPTQISQALGPDTIRELARRFDMSEQEVSQRLSQELPQAVDKLTPQGRLPTHDELSAWR